MIRKFMNGNINCKIDYELEDKENALYELIYELEEHNINVIGEEFNLSNYEKGVYVTDENNDYKYTLGYNKVKRWASGRMIKLYAESFNNEELDLLLEG